MKYIYISFYHFDVKISPKKNNENDTKLYIERKRRDNGNPLGKHTSCGNVKCHLMR